MIGLGLAERGWLPEGLLRFGIRRLVHSRLAEADQSDAFLARLSQGPLAQLPDRANEQHYEVDPALFELVLGPHLKYSCGYFEGPQASLAEAEAAMLRLTCQHAELEDGMRILELGCGWGSLTLWMAEHHPNAHVTAVSNSKAQRERILARCADRGLGNVEVRTCDMNVFDPGSRFDRVVSVEMFEHMFNWPELLRRVRCWGIDHAELWHQRWRLFFLAVSELFGYRRGREWGVTHVLLEPRS